MRERAERRAARQTIGAYHEAQLRLLLDRVRDGFNRLDTGEIDAFELAELIHRYKRSARELWKFCGQTGSDRMREWRAAPVTPLKLNALNSAFSWSTVLMCICGTSSTT